MKIQTNVKAGAVEFTLKSTTDVSVKSTTDISLKVT
jgi:hypothetical protein